MQTNLFQPTTSLEARRMVVQLSLPEQHHYMIYECLKYYKSGLMYEEIAEFCNLDPVQVGRRLCEMRRSGTVERSELKRKTSKGCRAYIHIIKLS